MKLHDATSRHREERRANQLQKLALSKRLAASLADNLASPISVIRNRSEQPMHQVGDYLPMRETFVDIQRGGGKLTQRLVERSAFPKRYCQVLSLNGILRRMSKFIQYRIAIRSPSPLSREVLGKFMRIRRRLLSRLRN